MSIQICRDVVLVIRSTCCHTIRSRSCLRKGVLVPVVPGAPVLQRRAYSWDTFSPGRPTIGHSSQQPCVKRLSSSSALTQKKLSAVGVQGQCRPPCNFDFMDIEKVKESLNNVNLRRKTRHFIVDPAVAHRVVEHLGPEILDAKAVLFECNPGPGVLTKTLLNAGAQRIVALEGDRPFLPILKDLEGRLDGQLEVLHCDYFKLDPVGLCNVQVPIMYSDKLFNDLGISEAKWTDDIPVKVVGILPHKTERLLLLKMIYALLEQLSVFRYGRIELNLFMKEKEYRALVAHPSQGTLGSSTPLNYFWQMACDVELLHMEPVESFILTSGKSPSLHKGKVPYTHMCLVRLRPRAELFSGGLTPSNASALITLVQQCLGRKTSRLIDKLNVWCPGSGLKLLSQMNISKDIMTGQVNPQEYLQLFQLMDKSQDFSQSWLFQETEGNKSRNSWI